MRSCLLMGIFLAAVSRCSAQSDLARIRNAIHLPHIAVQFTIEFDPSGTRFASTSSSQPNPTAQIADLKKLIHGELSDAAVYVKIAESYDVTVPDSDAKIADAYRRAISLFQKQLLKRPNDGWVMSQLGDVLYITKRPADAEKWLRQAVQEAPNDWRCWANLGDYIQGIALAKVLDNDKVGLAPYTDITIVQRMLEPLTRKQGLDSKAVEAFAAFQKEAREAYDKAVKLAPSVSGPYERRFSFGFSNQMLAQNILRVARGEEPVYSLQIPDAVLDDEWKASELSPEDTHLQYNSLILEIRSHADKLMSDQPNDLHTQLSKLPQNRRDKIANGLERLTKCASNPDHVISASTLVALASVYFLLSDIDDASKAASQAAGLDPNSPQAAQAVVATYLAGKRYTELAGVLQDQIKHQDSAYRRLCLAHVYVALGNAQGVTEQVLTGLRLFPDDLLLNLALADGLMKATGPESLKKAGDVMSLAQTLFDKLPKKEQQANQANLDVTRGIYLALIGKSDVAKLALQRVLSDDPGNAEAREAMTALEKQ